MYSVHCTVTNFPILGSDMIVATCDLSVFDRSDLDVGKYSCTTLYSVVCIVYSVYYTVQCTVYIIQCTMYNIHCICSVYIQLYKRCNSNTITVLPLYIYYIQLSIHTFIINSILEM